MSVRVLHANAIYIDPLGGTWETSLIVGDELLAQVKFPLAKEPEKRTER